MYNASTLLQFLIGGISVGCIYGLVGVGFSVLYNASGIINFAQGGFVMLGGMVTYVLYSLVGLPLIAAMIAAIAFVALLGLVIEWTIIKPLRQRSASVFIMILATLACQILIENAALHLIDDKPHSLPYFTPGPPLQYAGIAIGLQTLWIIGVSLLIVFLLGLFYSRTQFGRAMRACAINPEVASILGMRVERMVASGFLLSAALGAIGGILITPTQYTAFFVGVPFTVSGFVAAIIGGLGNPLGAFIGGIVLGVLQSAGAVFIDAGYKNVVAFGVLLCVLFLRPQGFFKSLVE
ncbi:MAG: branched-chain amino acid ABC transporter permease [Alphaproteobacteria bacterium]|nr:branched-chain amino acid ABC transporter permease [Alphaproteobacteria bacterium]